MTLASSTFVAFFGVVFVAYWALPRWPQNVLLVVASLVFYGWIHPWYVLLLLYSATLDYSCGRAMGRWPARKGLFLAASIVGNLGLLSAFKYLGFFVGSVADLLTSLGVEANLPTLEILLPIGISFYTFQSLSYSFDVYRGRSKPCDDPLAFLLFVSFFPQLVMGPIGRARLMLPQIAATRRFEAVQARSGLSLLLWGGFKKVVVADTLAGFVRPTFESASPSGAMVWSAAAAASVMMFADFSGYTDMARGSARMLGFDLPRNFNAPYLATTPSEWWKRWHISFFEWMGEYVFRPITLGRWWRTWVVPPFVTPTQTTHVVRGVMLTMLLSGLWHGAAWHYVVWGGFFGVIQVVYFVVGRRLPERVRAWRHRNWVLRPLMILYVLVGEMLFQSRDVGRVVDYLTTNPLVGTVEQWRGAAAVVVATAVCAAPMVSAWALARHAPAWVRQPRAPLAYTTAWTMAAWSIWLFYRGQGSEFAYFQF